jgi:type IV pilus assembly protein PilY1
MNTVIRKTKWMSVGLLLALTCAAPVYADDTELLLLNPNAAAQAVPNVLLIIDSSGSMGNTEQTREVYDGAIAYVGGANACDPAYLYWTTYKNVTPSCDPANTQRILKSAFRCEDARNQIAGIGIYKGRMAQYRDGGSGFFSIFLGLDKFRWQNVRAGYETEIVECQKDRNKHGDGVNTSDLYAQKGGDVAQYTSDKKDEVSWGSWPTNQNVTVYDGNYLNYIVNPTFIQDSRINIVNNTAKAILNSISGISVGIMRFNNTQGGPVIMGVKDLDTNRAAILNTIDGIVAGGWTPVSETMYEAARYWRGLQGHYDNLINEHTTDPDALASTNPDVYLPPGNQSCAKNFNVVLTDGAPTNDTDPPGLVDSLPNWFGTQGYTGCTGAGDGACLDDIAAYLYNDDIAPNEPGVQTVTTHTIGFAIDLPILKEAAFRGGGEYFQADDVQSLTLALLEIVNNITDRALSFAAPAVAVNTFNRTQNFNDMYLSTFAASGKYHWPGNLKKYRLENGVVVDKFGQPAVNPATGLFNDTATSYWSSGSDGNDVRLGGAVENLPDPAIRNLYTNNTVDPNLTAAANAVSSSNLSSFTNSDFGVTGGAGEPTLDQLIRFARGEDITDFDLDPATTVRRAMGDPLHAQPAAVVYGGSQANPDIVVYSATNDGYVHAVDAANGNELWSFIPKEFLSKIPSLFFDADSATKNYGVDGDIVAVTADRDDDGVVEPADGDFVHIIFGMRRGGSAYYSLDVTDKNNPKVNWRISAAEFGQSWSRPTIARVDMAEPGLNNDNAVVIIGGGYDSVHDSMSHPAMADTQGAGVYMFDLMDGTLLWRAGADGSAQLQIAGMTRAIPSQVQAIDLNGNGYIDRMYASDMGGQLVRFDVFPGNDPDGIGADALVTGGVIAQLGAEGLVTPTDPETRRFYTSPDVSMFNDTIQNRRFMAISIGSGYRAHPLDNTNNDRFYSIRDQNVFSKMTQAEHDAFTPIDDAELVEISGTVGTAIGQNQRGWKFTLPADQKVLSSSVTFNNEIFFVAFSPDAAGAAACTASNGRNFLYRISVVNGDPITDLSTIVPGQEDNERVTDLAQGGIAPSPRFLFPSPDANCTGDECSPPPIGCIGVECFNPGFENNPVRTLWTQDGIE